jgi:hypothetical protein
MVIAHFYSLEISMCDEVNCLALYRDADRFLA